MRVHLIFLASLVIALLINTVSSKYGDRENNHLLSKRSWITDFVEKILRKIKGQGKDVGKQCFDKKKKGLVPSAEHRDSPLKTFGFPYFNEKARTVVVRPGVTLSYMFGFRQPVKIGSRDYVIAGYANELLAFFACFENYKVIGSSLGQDGHWLANSGTIKIQLQNLNTKFKMTDDLWEMVFKISMDRIIKYLNPTQIISDLDAQLLGGEGVADKLKTFADLINKIKEYLPGAEKFIKKFLKLYAKKDVPIEEKIKEFIAFVQEEEKRKSKLRKQWIGMDDVSKDEKILVTLTMYEKPEHGVRSTYNMGRATVTMKDIGDAFIIFLGKNL